MRSKIIRFFGLSILLFGLILGVLQVFWSIFSDNTTSSWRFVGILIGVCAIVTFYSSGKFYMRVGAGQVPRTKLVTAAFICMVVAAALILFSILIQILSTETQNCFWYNLCDGFALVFIYISGVIPAAVLYIIGTVLLIINKVKQ